MKPPRGLSYEVVDPLGRSHMMQNAIARLRAGHSKKLLSRGRRMLHVLAGALVISPPLHGFEVCPTPATGEAMYRHTLRTVLGIPSYFDEQRDIRDHYLREFALGMAAAGQLERASDIADYVSAPVERLRLQLRIGIEAAERGDTGLADRLTAQALRELQQRTLEERLDAYRELMYQFTGKGLPEVVQQIDTLRLNDREQKAVERYAENEARLVPAHVSALVASATTLTNEGLYSDAARRIVEAEELSARLVEEPNPQVEWLTRAALLRLKLHGLQSAVATAETIAEPSERALLLGHLAEALHASQADVDKSIALKQMHDSGLGAKRILLEEKNGSLILASEADYTDILDKSVRVLDSEGVRRQFSSSSESPAGNSHVHRAAGAS